MDHKDKLDKLNKEALQKFDDYVKSKPEIKKEDHEALHQAKDEWQAAWIKLRDALMVLERLEI